MKIQCIAEVQNRSLALSNIKTNRKPVRSCLAIGRPTVKSDELFLLLQNQQNKEGVKYKVNDNIEHVFAKFMNDGKATIRLIQPPHDLIIQANAIQLKSFLHTLKLGMFKNANLSVLDISNLNPKSMSVQQKTKIVIQNKSNYPTLEGFPRTTEELRLIGLERRSFDRQILKLQSLKILDMSQNQLTSLPKEIGCLPNLQQLILSDNLLGKCHPTKWNWLSQPMIRRTLLLLDISKNMITELPREIGDLSALVNLKINRNLLITLPQTIGKLSSLTYFDMSNNKLKHLPGTIRYLRLLEIDISENEFQPCSRIEVSTIATGVPTLVEYAAKVFLKTRRLYDASIIPLTLVRYLDNAKYCVCGAACFDVYIKKNCGYNLYHISNSIKSSGNVFVPFNCYFCNVSCIRYLKS